MASNNECDQLCVLFMSVGLIGFLGRRLMDGRLKDPFWGFIFCSTEMFSGPGRGPRGAQNAWEAGVRAFNGNCFKDSDQGRRNIPPGRGDRGRGVVPRGSTISVESALCQGDFCRALCASLVIQQ
jgi:hypothetical protein